MGGGRRGHRRHRSSQPLLFLNRAFAVVGHPVQMIPIQNFGEVSRPWPCCPKFRHDLMKCAATVFLYSGPALLPDGRDFGRYPP